MEVTGDLDRSSLSGEVRAKCLMGGGSKRWREIGDNSIDNSFKNFCHEEEKSGNKREIFFLMDEIFDAEGNE